MPNKAKQLLQFKTNPPLAMFQATEAMKIQLETLVRSLIAQEIKGLKKEIGNINTTTELPAMELVDKITRNVLADIKGEQGIEGIEGKVGPKGESIKGERGEVGKDGKIGSIGPRGIQGFTGASIKGNDGRNGKDFDEKKITKLKEFILERFEKFEAQFKNFKTQQRRFGATQQVGGGGFDEVRRYIVDEAPDGVKTSGQLTFTLSNTPTDGTLVLYLNGQRLEQGASSDYTVSTNVITFVSGREPLASDENLRADYIKKR